MRNFLIRIGISRGCAFAIRDISVGLCVTFVAFGMIYDRAWLSVLGASVFVLGCAIHFVRLRCPHCGRFSREGVCCECCPRCGERFD